MYAYALMLYVYVLITYTYVLMRHDYHVCYIAVLSKHAAWGQLPTLLSGFQGLWDSHVLLEFFQRSKEGLGRLVYKEGRAA